MLVLKQQTLNVYFRKSERMLNKLTCAFCSFFHRFNIDLGRDEKAKALLPDGGLNPKFERATAVGGDSRFNLTANVDALKDFIASMTPTDVLVINIGLHFIRKVSFEAYSAMITALRDMVCPGLEISKISVGFVMFPQYWLHIYVL